MKLSLANKESFFKNWPEDWPSQEFFVSQHDVTELQYNELLKLLKNKASETEIEKYLRSNKQALALILGLFQTGHHATWIIPKQVIRTRLGEHAPGLIPDYLVAGANSDGLSWWVLELKGSDAKVFSSNSTQSFSTTANRGIVQLLEYIDACSEVQSYLRDQLGLKGFREPRGILLIGTEEEFSEKRRQKLKSAWNRNMPKIQIRSYSALLREIALKIQHNEK